MEVALTKRDEAAARQWYITPNSGSGVSDLQFFMNASTMLQQSSALPKCWMPTLLSGALLMSYISPYIAGVTASDPLPNRIRQDQSHNADVLALLNGQLERLVTPLPARTALLTILSPPITSQYIEELESSLKFTRSQIAQALGVERATLYQWFRGAQPRPKTGERLETIRQFAEEWKRAGLGSARAAWHFRAPGNDKTLGLLLTAEEIDLQKLRMHIQYAQRSPQALQLVSPRVSGGFSAKDSSEERKRTRALFPPTYSESE